MFDNLRNNSSTFSFPILISLIINLNIEEDLKRSVQNQKSLGSMDFERRMEPSLWQYTEMKRFSSTQRTSNLFSTFIILDI